MPNPPGQVFRKCDLHTHTPASRCYRFREHTAEELVQAALEQQLDAIAVTDHNSGAWVDEMKRAAESTGLTIFPGTEISAHENYHVVVIFDPSMGRVEVEGLLSELSFQPDEFGNSEVTCKKSIFDIFEVARKRGALVVLAHIDEVKGAFFQQSENRINEKTGERKVYVPATCSQLFNYSGYHAVEVTQGRLPDGFDQEHNIQRLPAFYQSSDNVDPENPTKHSLHGYARRYSWFSMDEISLEGLRQCFADPDVRIRQMNEYNPHIWPHIVSMRFGAEGFLAYQRFSFHPGLNSLIGHKGTGKSLAIEALRFALDQGTQQAELRKDHIGKIDMLVGHLAEFEVDFMHQNGTVYTVTCKNEGAGRATRSVVNTATGKPYSGDLQRLFPVLAYSQTEVIKISEDEQAQLRLADALIDTAPQKAQIRHIQDKLAINDSALTSALAAHARLEDVEAEKATLEERIANIDRMLTSQLLDEMRQAETINTILERQKSVPKNMSSALSGQLQELDSRSLPEIPDAVADNPILAKNQQLLLQTRSAVLEQVRRLISDLDAVTATITRSVESWKPEFESIRALYDRELHGTDSAKLEVERRNVQAELERTREQVGQYHEQATVQLPQLLNERKKLLKELQDAYRAHFEQRKEKFQQLTTASAGKVRLTIEYAQNIEQYAQALSDILRGSGPESVSNANRRQLADRLDPVEFGNLVIARDVEALAERSGLTSMMSERVMNRLWSHDDFPSVLALQHDYFPEDVPEIEFNKGNEYAPIDQLSVGQKCTALLIIALCDGSMPVIIDQPEDALDIASVWDDVAHQLRFGKAGRQFILTTHNSSLAVGGDSDNFHILKPVGGNRAKIANRGAIDRQAVRRDVIDLLEGGDKPYRLKHEKYNVQQ